MSARDFSHLDKKTGNPNMVDVGEKQASHRSARASCRVILGKEIVRELGSSNELITKKGPVFQTAIIAGTMGAKQTANLIPLCHPLGLDDCKVSIDLLDDTTVLVQCAVKVFGKTGVEMEAMTGVSVAALTIYDMCKGFSHDITIEAIKLEEKKGGKRDFKR
ncbi:cyclic pyranopterin phosphate synthase [Cyclobacterium lianum]|uniref:cyclic pyranopterin monophosphate synthase n=1 Tax=Cyclobacterium lianum TaxID=388280 RepID=A0A1M7L3Y4_9BACT|nr:cyclic pyranopterin monophosphate synthase MoaC [Cyclobacterium lianum]SHM72027.1 cyclic pyranopterin phosphate synthase [Cyclobacterium lianum]